MSEQLRSVENERAIQIRIAPNDNDWIDTVNKQFNNETIRLVNRNRIIEKLYEKSKKFQGYYEAK